MTTIEAHSGEFLGVVHPGEILVEELEERGLSARALAREIDVPANRITQIIRGERGVSGDTALRLGHWFGMSAEFWMNLQKTYELNLARQERGSDIDGLPRYEEPREAAE